VNINGALFIVVIVVTIIAIGFVPVKQATKKDYLDKNDEYIVVVVQKATISEWSAIGDNQGDYSDPNDVRLLGNAPSGYNYGIEFGFNTFVCYGKYDGTGDLHGEKYDYFYVERWEILYPVTRDSIFADVLPKSYLCIYDFR